MAQALGELGRIPKTLHLLTFIDDPSYRRGILTQLNRGEGRHRLARKCFHGQRGELRQRYREGQEDQLGALGLVVNALVLWNTRYMDAALSHLRSQGAEVKPVGSNDSGTPSWRGEGSGRPHKHNGVPSLNWKSLRNLRAILILFNLHGLCFDFSTCSVYSPKFFLLKERDLIGNVR